MESPNLSVYTQGKVCFSNNYCQNWPPHPTYPPPTTPHSPYVEGVAVGEAVVWMLLDLSISHSLSLGPPVQHEGREHTCGAGGEDWRWLRPAEAVSGNFLLLWYNFHPFG